MSQPRGEQPDALVPSTISGGRVLAQRVCGSLEVQNGPRVKDRGRVSLILGLVTPEEAFRIVRKTAAAPTTDDGVRYTTAEQLRDAGFVVEHAPNNRNPDHVTVSYPGEWDSAVALLFSECSLAPRRGERCLT